MKQNIKEIALTGAGTEIPNFNVSQSFEGYFIKGTAIAIGNYAITIVGTPQVSESYTIYWTGTLDITTNSKTFSVLGQSLTQEQLNTSLIIKCDYTGSSWVVKVIGSLEEEIIDTLNIMDDAITTPKILNGAVTNPKLATDSVSTIKIQDDAVTTSKIDDLAVTNAKINDIDGSKIVDDSVTNAKLAEMPSMTVKANLTGGNANPSDEDVCSLVGNCAWLLTGNTGLDSSINFLGTTDDVDLIFKRNNIISGKINISNSITAFGLGSSVSSGGNLITSFGASSAYGSSGNNLTLIGINSGESSTGSHITAIGYYSGVNAADNYITLIGENTHVTGDYGIALGYSATAIANQFAIPDNVTKIKWRGVSYTLPAADGSAGQSLKTDGSGNLYWG